MFKGIEKFTFNRTPLETPVVTPMIAPKEQEKNKEFDNNKPQLDFVLK